MPEVQRKVKCNVMNVNLTADPSNDLICANLETDFVFYLDPIVTKDLVNKFGFQ